LLPERHGLDYCAQPTKMADTEFEEFSDLLDELPQHFKATQETYT
jgi:hypothetical protein